MQGTPVRVAAVNDYELIVVGLEHLLRGFPDTLAVCDRIVVGEPIDAPVDVALFDLDGRLGVAGTTLRTLAEDPKVGHVAVFSLELGPDLIAEGRAAGASAFISKALSASEIADEMVPLCRGRPRRRRIAAVLVPPHPGSRWPAQSAGLTRTRKPDAGPPLRGLVESEIAAELFLSAESVKSYVGRIFQKLGVRNRVEAAAFVHRSLDFRR